MHQQLDVDYVPPARNFIKNETPKYLLCYILHGSCFPTIPNLLSSIKYSESYNGLKNLCNEQKVVL